MSTKPVKEFTEKWLQALTLAAKHLEAQRVKPFLTDIDAISTHLELEDRVAAGKRVWEYCQQNSLASWLTMTPCQQSPWTFEDEDRFTFEPASRSTSTDVDSWLSEIGVLPQSVKLIATVNQVDWTALLRKELVRNGRALNMSAMPEGTMLRLPCSAQWDGKCWKIGFENPDWLSLPFEGRFLAPRPNIDSILEAARWSMAEANDLLVVKKGESTSDLGPCHWSSSIPGLQPLHRDVLEERSKAYKFPFRRAWAAAWPVVLREQNRLRGECDLAWIRTELEACFQGYPKLTLWMFAFAKLVCTTHVGAGLGVSGDFVA